jgi:hypothetical protein
MNFKNILFSLAILFTFSVRATCIEVIKQQFSDVLEYCEKYGPTTPTGHLNAHIQELAMHKKINQLESLQSFLTTYKQNLNYKKTQQISTFKFLLLKKCHQPLLVSSFILEVIVSNVKAAACVWPLEEKIIQFLMPTYPYRLTKAIPALTALGLASYVGNLVTKELINSYTNQTQKITYLDKTIEIINNLLTQIATSKALYNI